MLASTRLALRPTLPLSSLFSQLSLYTTTSSSPYSPPPNSSLPSPPSWKIPKSFDVSKLPPSIFSSPTSSSSPDPSALSFDLYKPVSVQVYSGFDKQPLRLVEVPRHLLTAPPRKDIIHRCVVWHLAEKRQGTAKAKNRSEVQGSTKKMRRQKGLGRARVGSKRPPHFRGGGVAFPPVPRDFSLELPMKVRHLGIRVALTTKYVQNQLFFFEDFTQAIEKTSALQKTLTQHKWIDDLILFVTVQTGKIERAASNISTIKVIQPQDLNVFDLMKYKKVILTLDALEWLKNRAPEP
jgi:large subunit ribosomal protein L4